MSMAAVRLEMWYRYGNTTVYNNFIVADLLQKKIGKCVQVILGARTQYEGSACAGLYYPDNEFCIRPYF